VHLLPYRHVPDFAATSSAERDVASRPGSGSISGLTANPSGRGSGTGPDAVGFALAAQAECQGRVVMTFCHLHVQDDVSARPGATDERLEIALTQIRASSRARERARTVAIYPADFG
jgi:hypothetical protein